MVDLVNADLALYIHIPWCVQKCPYCDFNSHALKTAIPEKEYLEALMRDLDFALLGRQELRPLKSIFFGGGTPSIFSPAAIGQILSGVNARLNFASTIEITLEANPSTVDAERFTGFKSAGINRLSMGVQSLNDAHLKALGRIHGSTEAVQAFKAARLAKFDNINLDLMFALPAQTLAQANDDVRQLIALAPEHISYYHLTLEPNTAFYRNPPALPDSDLAYEILEQGAQCLAASGYVQYETSAYAKAGRASQHNLNYWRFGDYLGIGAGAHAKHSDAKRNTITRTARHKHPKTYMERAGLASCLQEERVLSASELPIEFAMNALRLHEGFSVQQFEQRTGLNIAVLMPTLHKVIAKGLLEQTGDWYMPSALGRAHLNTLLLEFL